MGSEKLELSQEEEVNMDGVSVQEKQNKERGRDRETDSDGQMALQ